MWALISLLLVENFYVLLLFLFFLFFQKITLGKVIVGQSLILFSIFKCPALPSFEYMLN